jgi:hypothetical protein
MSCVKCNREASRTPAQNRRWYGGARIKGNKGRKNSSARTPLSENFPDMKQEEAEGVPPTRLHRDDGHDLTVDYATPGVQRQQGQEKIKGKEDTTIVRIKC